MRIAYVVADGGIPIFGHKGASVHVREFVRALGAGHSVDLFCAALGNNHDDLPIERLHVVSQSMLPVAVDRAIERDRRRLAIAERMKVLVDEVHQAEGFDAIYERYALFSDVGAALADTRHVPFLLEVNAPLIVERQQVEPLPLSSLARDIETRVFRRADAVVAVSETMAEYVVNAGASRERVHVVPNGVDTSRFHPGVEQEHVRAMLGIEDCLVIGFAGSLKTWHGVDLLLEAFARVAEPNWRLLIVGDGPERDHLDAKASALKLQDRTIFAGAIRHDAVPEYIAAMDIAVAPYRAVPDFYFSPLKLFEYLALGRPVVAANVGQISAVIRHEDNGYLVEPDDVASLSQALSRLSSDEPLRVRLGDHAPIGLVTWGKTAQRVTSIMRELTGTRAGI